jgi:hypothetical protein
MEEEFEYTKGVIRIHISKNRLNKWPKEKVQKEKNDLQSIHIKLKIE